MANLFMSIYVVSILICASYGSEYVYTHSIKTRALDSSRPRIMIAQNSLRRFITYPCELGTEDYQYEGYIVCDRRHDYVPPKPKVWPSPFSKPRTDI